MSSLLISLVREYPGRVENALRLKTHAAQLVQQNLSRTNEVMDTVFDIRRMEYMSALSQERNIFSGWELIASRDAAMSVFHFAKSMEALKANLHQCETLKSAVDKAAMRAATREFTSRFPQYEPIRHAIAHHGELRRSVAVEAKNAASGPFDKGGLKVADGAKGLHLTGSLNGEMLVTIEGHLLTFKLDEECLAGLRAVASSFNDCFLEASRAIHEAATR